MSPASRRGFFGNRPWSRESCLLKKSRDPCRIEPRDDGAGGMFKGAQALLNPGGVKRTSSSRGYRFGFPTPRTVNAASPGVSLPQVQELPPILLKTPTRPSDLRHLHTACGAVFTIAGIPSLQNNETRETEVFTGFSY